MKSNQYWNTASATHLGVAFALLACSPTDVVKTDDVLTLTCASDCDAPADGKSTIKFQACVPTAERRKDLSVRFTTSAGSWKNPKEGEATASEVPLGRNQCVNAELIPPRAPGSAQVTAELGGFQQSVTLDLKPVALATLEVTPQPALLAYKKPSTVIVNAVVRAASGSPSDGTLVSFLISARDPEQAHAVIFPSSVRADSDGRASATLTVASDARSVVLNVQAQVPGADGTAEEVLLMGEGGAPP